MAITRPDPKLKDALDVLEGWECRVVELQRALAEAEAEYNNAVSEMQAARHEAVRRARLMFGLIRE